MSAYAETQFENKAICLSLGERNEQRSNAGSAKNDDECAAMKPACTSMSMMIPDSSFFIFSCRRENAGDDVDWWWFISTFLDACACFALKIRIKFEWRVSLMNVKMIFT